jgi:hypothetical protein
MFREIMKFSCWRIACFGPANLSLLIGKTFIRSIAVVAGTVVLTAGSPAQATTYFYEGNPFTDFSPQGCCDAAV